MLKDFKCAYKHIGYHNNAIWQYAFDPKNILDECTKDFDKFIKMNNFHDGNLKEYISDDRYMYTKGKGAISIDNFLNKFEESIIDCVSQLVNDKWSFKNYIQPSWPFSSNEWLEYMHVSSHIMLDNNGYSMNAHEDNNKIVCNFIANLSENTCGTRFYHPVFANKDNWKYYHNSCENDIVYEASGQSGIGICWFNNRGSIHSIDVNCNNRFTAMGSLRLNIIKN